jgi:hypothetical protein
MITSALILALWCCESSTGTIIVQQAGLSVEVQPYGFPLIRDTFLPDLSNFQDSHGVSYSQSFANAQYVSSVHGDEFDFHVSSQQHLEGTMGRVQNINGWSLTPSVNSVLTIQGEYLYNHPPTLLGDASLDTSLRLYDTNQLVDAQIEDGGTSGFGPYAGLLSINATVPLSAGVKYHFACLMSSHGFDPPSPGQAWRGDGSFDISVRPIPEPAALLPLAALLYLAPGRRRKSEIPPPPGPQPHQPSLPFLISTFYISSEPVSKSNT